MSVKPTSRTPGPVVVQQTPAEASKAALLADCKNAGVRLNQLLDNGYNSFVAYVDPSQVTKLKRVLKNAGCKETSDTYYGAPVVAWQDSNGVKFIIMAEEASGGAAVMPDPTMNRGGYSDEGGAAVMSDNFSRRRYSDEGGAA